MKELRPTHERAAFSPALPGFGEFPEWAFAVPAVAVPLLLAWNVPPSSTFLNQAVAICGWGLFLWAMLLSLPARLLGAAGRRDGLLAVSACVGLLAVAAVAASFRGDLPASLSLSALGLLAAALLTVWAAALIAARRGPDGAMAAFCVALVVAGLLSAGVAGIQVFEPGWTDGDWIAATSLPGRAAGNLRQPNHLSSLTLWALVALAWLADSGRLRKPVAAVIGVLLVYSVVLSFSRTGTIGVVLLALWGLAGRRLSRGVRWSLASAPVWYALGWWTTTEAVDAAASGAARFSTHGDISSSRFAIWSNTLDMIRHHPWTGVGFGDFNFAWTLTPYPHRPVAFFDHTHNLVLQLAVELGLPMAALLLALLVFATWCVFRAARREADPCRAVALQAAFMLVLLMVVHSQLEYPLWYAYFLLPTAFAMGVCLHDSASRSAQHGPANDLSHTVEPARMPLIWLQLGAALMVAGGVYSVVDYWKVVVIFAPGPEAAPLSERIEQGKRSLFFAHHAHYAAATTTERPSQAMDSFKVASHFLLDTRLMMAWAKAYHELGDDDRARYLADRLKEFHNAASETFLAACAEPVPAGAAAPFQCTAAKRQLDPRDFR